MIKRYIRFDKDHSIYLYSDNEQDHFSAAGIRWDYNRFIFGRRLELYARGVFAHQSQVKVATRAVESLAACDGLHSYLLNSFRQRPGHGIYYLPMAFTVLVGELAALHIP